MQYLSIVVNIWSILVTQPMFATFQACRRHSLCFGHAFKKYMFKHFVFVWSVLGQYLTIFVNIRSYLPYGTVYRTYRPSQCPPTRVARHEWPDRKKVRIASQQGINMIHP